MKKQSTIFNLIKADHRKAEALFAKLEKTTERSKKQREKLYAELRSDLSRHIQAEEEAIYPHLKEAQETEDIGYEAAEEHDVAKTLMKKLDATEPDTKEWTALICVLQESIEHHVKEEEKEMFAQMRKAFHAEDLKQFAIDFQNAKKGWVGRMMEQVAA